MATPTYLGPGQPLASNGNGFLGRLGSLFGGGATPQYIGEGQPTSSGGFLGGATQAYLPAPADEPTQSEEPSAACASCPIDPEALASGRIAILIPRQWDPCRDEETAATD